MGLAILIVWVIILGIAILLIVSNIKIVPQAHAYVVERLGGYKETWGVGLHFKMPILDRVARRVSLKEQVVDFEPQAVITKDNVTMQIDTVVFYQITDPKKYAYGVESPIAAIENLTATTLRNIIGDLELDETLTSRETINSKMRTILDIATDEWGIKVNRVELKNIMPPKAIQDAMEKQTCACDMRILGESFKMNAGYLSIGYTGTDMGGAFFLPKIIGYARAAQVLMNPARHGAEELLDWGFANKVVADEDVVEEAVKLAEEICASTAPFGLRLTKECLQASLDGTSFENVIRMENRNQVLASNTQDGIMGTLKMNPHNKEDVKANPDKYAFHNM